MRWLITGAGGYIGSHLVSHLIRKKQTFLAISGKSRSSLDRLSFLKADHVVIDVADDKTTYEIITSYKPDVVIHLASLKSPAESNRLPERYIKHNTSTLKNVFKASESSGAKVFINASSSAVYGNLDSLNILEESATNPISAYGLSKLLGEQFLDSQSDSEIQSFSLRLFNVIGSECHELRERATFHLLPATFLRLRSGKQPIIYGFNLPTLDGTAIRDYVHVLDVIELIDNVVAHIFSLRTKKLAHTHIKINVGSGKGSSVLQLIDIVQELLGTNFTPIFESARPGDPISSVSNISLAKTHFDFYPSADIKRMIASSL